MTKQEEISAAFNLGLAKDLALYACRLITTEEGGEALAAKLREYASWLEAGAFEKRG